MKKTIAFIGFHKQLVGLLTKLLSEGYPVLVTDQVIPEELYLLKNTLSVQYSQSSLELHTCSKECAWESDIIILSVEVKALEDLCVNIKNVVTGKILVTSEDQVYYEQLKVLFPFSKVVWINKDQVFSEDVLAADKITQILHA